ncbi:hypothetical protein CkaCkLH20_02542 [Colletotrichum karsti]|uniref:Uncharacterized protein n=1 Tax=Colletotrichum karsti TaxID=1095194 RepID=A0A9P6ID99_9PEZI|nr:uncharacterized protein CkaCkLH20_02542 [Colletotrichum karsti]KAF9879731.1 hypothetical protein CkaCkLH20_02542 [Colletotrichum karsti]
MAPRRRAALAAQANMAAFAAQDTEADIESPVPAPKTLKSAKIPKAANAKVLKPLKKIKPANAKADSKGPAYKPAQRKQSEPKNPDGNPIPLLCCVCPSTPRFSDVSHLLTHLSSKGHLHILNTTRLTSLADFSALQTITDFDKWYDANGLHQLLAERLKAAKDGKERGKRAGQPLVQPLKKKKTLASVKTEIDGDAPWTPSKAKKNGSFAHQQDITFYGDHGETSVMSPTESIPDNTEYISEAMRLKGIVWPGMSLFDAATPEQRKKRNQRKDASVIQQMKLDSQAVTSVELVANLTLEVERTRDVYDAPSVEGTPPAKKPRGRQRRNNVAREEDLGSPVKPEPESDDELPKQTTRARRGRAKKELKVQVAAPEPSPSPEPVYEYQSERFEVASNEGASYHGSETAPSADTSLVADMTADVGGDADSEDEAEVDSFDAEMNTSEFAEQMNNFTRSFTIPESDVFHDGSAGQMRARPEYMQQARSAFDLRNRIPLQAMNPNSSMSLASPTPAAKQLSYRNFTGHENNLGLQDQGLGNHSYIGGPNTHLNQRRLPMGTMNNFNNYPQPHSPDIAYQQDYPNHWLPLASRGPTAGFNPINGHSNQQPFFGNHFFNIAANTFADNDHSQAMSMFRDGV